MTILSLKNDETISKNALQVKRQLKDWNYLITVGLTNVMADISRTMGCGIKVEKIKIGQIPATCMADMLVDREKVAVGIYLAVSGVVGGHIMMAFRLRFAHMILKIISDSNRLSSKNLTEIDQSVLGKIGNIMMKPFISSVADTLGSSLLSSSPIVLIDTPASLEGIVKAEILQGQASIFVAEAMLCANDHTYEENFLIIPDQSLLQLPMSLSARLS